MGARERLIACVVVALLLVVVAWLAVVSPERSKANNLQSQISSERTTVASEQAQLAVEERARASYPAAVHALSVLVNAIPTSDQEPQLIQLVNALENGHVIDWQTTSFASSSASGFQGINISFTFTAGYVNLQQFIGALDALDQTDGQNILAKGRLVTVDSLSLSPAGGGKTSAAVAITVYQQSGVGATGPGGTVTTTAATQ